MMPKRNKLSDPNAINAKEFLSIAYALIERCSSGPFHMSKRAYWSLQAPLTATIADPEYRKMFRRASWEIFRWSLSVTWYTIISTCLAKCGVGGRPPAGPRNPEGFFSTKQFVSVQSPTSCLSMGS